MDAFLKRLSFSEVALLAKYGDEAAYSYLWEAIIPNVSAVTKSFAARYPRINQEDFEQSVLCAFPKILRRYDPYRGKAFEIYLYFSAYRLCQDLLRANDPLGVKIPQKAPYPKHFNLSELDQLTLEQTINDGLDNIDRCRFNTAETRSRETS